MVLRHEGGAVSTLRASLRVPLGNDLVVEGTRGRLHVEGPIYRPFSARVFGATPSVRGAGVPRFERLRESGLAQGLNQRLAGLRGGGTRIRRHFSGNGYGYEAEAVMAAARASWGAAR